MKIQSLLFIAILFVSCNTARQTYWNKKDKTERSEKKKTYWAAGYMELDEIFVRQKVFRKYGLEYEPVWGCQTNKVITKSINKHNAWVLKNAGFKNPASILKEIYSHIDSVYKIDSGIIDYLQQDNKLNRAVYGYLNKVQGQPGKFSVEDGKKENVYIVNYNEIDDYGKRQKLLLSLEITLPDYAFTILTPGK
jgi:hypothetical protein